MQNLKKLIQFISHKGKKYILQFEQQAIKPGKEQVLFQGITGSVFQNDHSAADYLYKSSPEEVRYVILKSRLEGKLLDFLLYLDLTDGNWKKEKSPKSGCELMIYQAKMLFRYQEYHISERLLKKALRTAKEYDFTALQLEATEQLLQLYFTTEAGMQHQHLQEEFIRQMHIVSAERTATLLFQKAHLKLLQDKTGEDKLAYINYVTDQLQQLWKEHQSFTLFDLYYKLHVKQLELEEGYPQLLVLTTLAEEFVKDLKVNQKRFDFQHNHSLRVYASLRAGEITGGLQLARQGISLFDSSTEAWLTYYESYFLLALHAENYTLASDLYKQVEHSHAYSKTTSIIKEKWYLFRAFLYFMHPDEKNTISVEKDSLKQKLPYSRKDKQGYNIALLIIEFCFLLYTSQKDVLTKKAETYKKYVERHFNNGNLIRERIFFLLMLLVIRHNFQYELIDQKSAKLVRQLSQSVLPKGAHISNVEIIPYYCLWNKIKEILLRKE